MTNNPTEKIREVVEQMHEVAYHSRLSLPTGTREQCARWCNEEFVIPLLDAIIDLSKERGGDYADAFGMYMSELEEVKKVLSSNEKE